MYSFPATDDDLLRVMLACDALRQHWAKFRAMPYEGKFEGEVKDIRAIDYLAYEGLDFRKGEEPEVALVWGNVLAHQVGFDWHCSYRGDLVLVWGEPGEDRYEAAIWPTARVLEARIRGGIPTSEFFAWLTRRLIAGCLDQSSNPKFVSALLRLKGQIFDDA